MLLAHAKTEVWSTQGRRNLKTAFLLWQGINCCPSTLRRRNLETQQSQGYFGFVPEEDSNSGITSLSQRRRFEKLRFRNLFRPHLNANLAFLNSSGLKSVFEKIRSRDGLVWTVGLTVEIKLRFLINNSVEWTMPKVTWYFEAITCSYRYFSLNRETEGWKAEYNISFYEKEKKI